MRWSCLCWEFQVPMPNRKLIRITSIRQTRNLSHYQNVRPDNQSGANQYEGRFRLPYAVECGAKSPPPGEYPFYFRSDGKVGQVVMKSKNQTVGIVGIVQRQARKAGRDALMVRTKRSTRTLSVIRAAELEFVLDATHQANFILASLFSV